MGVDKWVSMDSTTPKALWGPCTTCSWRVGPFRGSTNLQFAPCIILMAWDATIGLVVFFSVCGVWSSMDIIQHTDSPTTTFTNYGVGLLMELGFCQPIEFDIVISSLCFGYDQALLQVVGMVPLLYRNNERTAYAFLNKMLNKFGVLVEIFTDQDMKF